MSESERTVFAPRHGIPVGTRLNGIYEIERLIAVGGMGEVYKGRAIQTGDAVAIKMIRPDMARNENALALFRKEAAALHNLYNEAIVRYYVFTIDPVTESPYLAMEFVDGQPLSDRIKQGPLSFEEVDVLRRRIASGPARRPSAGDRASRRLARQHHPAGRPGRARKDHRFRDRPLDPTGRRHRDRQRLCRQVQLRLAGTARPGRR
jgi:serine/threonine protein kinase